MTQPLSADEKRVLTGQAEALMLRFPPPPAAQLQWNPRAWMDESYDVAIMYGYLNGTLQNSSEVSVEYTKDVIDVSEARIVLAGYRLANLLREAMEILPPPPKATIVYPWLILGAAVFIGIVVALLMVYLGKCRKADEKIGRASSDDEYSPLTRQAV